jgi:hypothetical protein
MSNPLVKLVEAITLSPENRERRHAVQQALALMKETHASGRMSVLEYATQLHEYLEAIEQSPLPEHMKIELSQDAADDYLRYRDKVKGLVDELDAWVVDAAKRSRLPPPPPVQVIEAEPNSIFSKAVVDKFRIKMQRRMGIFLVVAILIAGLLYIAAGIEAAALCLGPAVLVVVIALIMGVEIDARKI